MSMSRPGLAKSSVTESTTAGQGKNAWSKFSLTSSVNSNSMRGSGKVSSLSNVSFTTSMQQCVYPSGIPEGVYTEVFDGNQDGQALKLLRDVTPLDLDTFLDKKGLLELYDNFIQDIVTCRDILITGNIMQEPKDVSLGRLKFDLTKVTRILQGKSTQDDDDDDDDDSQSEEEAVNYQQLFIEKGVKVIVCKLKDPNKYTVYRWMEFVDLEVAGTDYVSLNDVALVGGRRILPKGVVVRDFGFLKFSATKTKEQLVKEIPPALQELLESKDLISIYNEFMQSIVQSPNTIKSGGQVSMPDVLTVLQKTGCEEKFEILGVRVVACEEYTDGISNPKWIEFIDEAVAPEDYKAPYDIRLIPKDTSSSEQERYLHEGVAELVLMNAGKLQLEEESECPEPLKELLEPKDLLVASQAIIKEILGAKDTIENATADLPTKALSSALSSDLLQPFLEQGIQVVLCTGTFAGTFRETTRTWLEFIDTAVATGYIPTYDATKRNKIAEGQYIPPEGVAVEELVDGWWNNTTKLVNDCPEAVHTLLDEKDLLPEYKELTQAIAANDSTRSPFTGKWQSNGLVSVVDEYEETFAAKGVQVSVCKNKWNGKSYSWLEFIDTTVALDGNYMAPYNVKLQKKVLYGKHKVPIIGVEILELVCGKEEQSLRGSIPEELNRLLERKDALGWYQELVQSLVLKLPDNYSITETMQEQVIGMASGVDTEIIRRVNSQLEVLPDGVIVPKSMKERWEYAYPRIQVELNDFNSRPERNNLTVAICERQSDSGLYRWLEFIDRDTVQSYVSQYDMGNMSHQTLKTHLSILKFPNGVAIEELVQGSSNRARQNLTAEMPTPVKELMEKQDLMKEYHSLTKGLAAFGLGFLSEWDTERIRQVAQVHKPKFEAKGVSLFVSHKQEVVRKPMPGNRYHNEFYDHRWIEFVDRKLQPNYIPQRGIQFKPTRYFKSEHAMIVAEAVAEVTMAAMT